MYLYTSLFGLKAYVTSHKFVMPSKHYVLVTVSCIYLTASEIKAMFTYKVFFFQAVL